MENLRTQIKNRVSKALTDASVKNVTTIFRGISEDNLPVAYIDIRSAEFNHEGLNDIALRRVFELSISSMYASYEGVDEKIDENMVLIEKAIMSDSILEDKTVPLGFEIIRDDKLENLLVAHQTFTVTVFSSLKDLDKELI